MKMRFHSRLCALLLAALSLPAVSQRASQLATPTPLPVDSTLVIGFLGGYDRWDDQHRSVRRVVLKFRHTPGVYAESISNHRRSLAIALIRRALDSNRNNRLDPNEKSHARIILFGQSWGGAAVIDTARDLQKLGIPVLLTVQIDSVGFHDDVIPSNVLAAANFYQHDAFTLVHGQRRIRAADPQKTVILGNFEASYLTRGVDETDASWRRRVLGGSHTKLELDPVVWSRVEQYISDAISRRFP